MPSTPVFTANATASAQPQGWNLNGIQFDSWLRLNHNTSLTITQHPVETGAKITDHAYSNPKLFSFDIGMSDTINTSLVFGLFSNLFAVGAGRSINAYNALVTLQQTRQLLTLTSKYGTYQNLLIESIDVTDDFSTKNASRPTINLIEIFLTDVQLTIAVSTNPSATSSTNRGTVSATPAFGSTAAIQALITQLTAPLTP